MYYNVLLSLSYTVTLVRVVTWGLATDWIGVNYSMTRVFNFVVLIVI